MSHTHKLVIIGPSHHNTYSMVRCYGENGINPDVILYGKKNSYILRSCFIAYSYVTSDAAGALRVLQENYTEAVVIACADEIASLMDRDYQKLSTRFYFFNCGSNGRLTYFMDKAVQASVANEAGFKVPVSVGGTPSEMADKDLPYPCIVKPLESIHGGKNIQICQTQNDLPKAMTMFNPSERVLVQEFVEKEYEIVVVGLSFGNEIIIPAYIHKHRDNKGGTTYSTVKSIEDLSSNVLSACQGFIAEMKYQGLFGIELIRGKHDYYFIEVNLRNDATTYAIAVAGFNLPLAFWKLCNGENVESIMRNEVRQINAMVEFEDFNFVLKRKVSLFRWIREYRLSECKYFHSDTDIEVSKLKKKEYMKFLRKRIFKF